MGHGALGVCALGAAGLAPATPGAAGDAFGEAALAGELPGAGEAACDGGGLETAAP